MGDELSEKLKKFRLSEKEVNGLEISEDDFEVDLRDCKLSLIGKIYGEKKANFGGLKTTLSNIWSTEAPFTVRSIGANLFQFIFQKVEDKDKILLGKSWTFDGQYIILKEWNPNNTEFLEDDEKIKLCVQIHDLPLHLLTFDIGLKIGGIIGTVLDVLVPNSTSVIGRILRVLVEFNLKDKLLRGTNIKLGADNKWVEFRYENLQSFCFYCGRIGHTDRNCANKKEDISRKMLNLGQYGEWLRASSGYMGDFKSSKPMESGGSKGQDKPNDNLVESFDVADKSKAHSPQVDRDNDLMGLESETRSPSPNGTGPLVETNHVDLIPEVHPLSGNSDIDQDNPLLLTEGSTQHLSIGKSAVAKKRKPILRKVKPTSVLMEVDAGETLATVPLKSRSLAKRRKTNSLENLRNSRGAHAGVADVPAEEEAAGKGFRELGRVGQWSLTVSAHFDPYAQIAVHCQAFCEGKPDVHFQEILWCPSQEESLWLMAVRGVLLKAKNLGWTSINCGLSNKLLVE
ncbi:Unknown protein [Striga hermonthica]|uniref:CCHC-type domain-containing protein n=1 Tax=Striga hermonthica TaxID=68872 RepID=A0A9N7MGK4_STRHE|nr:Unknown protein [Striga hermonthica]